MTKSLPLILLTVVVAIIASWATVTFLAPQSAAGITEQRETAYERVMRTGTLRCAYASVGTPFSKNPATGEIEGYMADIVREIVKQLELEVEWTAEVGYGDFAEGFKTNRYDAFCGVLSVAPHRTRAAAFTDFILYYPYHAYVRQDEERFNTLGDLNSPSATYGAIDGEVFQKLSRQAFPNAEEKAHVNMVAPGQLFVDLATGKIDFLLHDVSVFKDYDSANSGMVRKAFEAPIAVSPVALAVGPHSHALRASLNTVIARLHDMGKIDKILNDYGLNESEAYRIAVPYRTEGVQ